MKIVFPKFGFVLICEDCEDELRYRNANAFTLGYWCPKCMDFKKGELKRVE